MKKKCWESPVLLGIGNSETKSGQVPFPTEGFTAGHLSGTTWQYGNATS